ncbi:restriction endonuclease subunit S [Aeromonas allosaccharophila]|uniref:restriction endonuclease subunit S n=1 Tax=Aeromonas allosaccharophila TaxID=656 RepID=UPI00300499B8
MAALKIENLITDHLDLWTAAVRPKSSAGRGSNSKLELTGIKKLRELILELAVRGKLVPQDPSDEPASVLLERIAAEKEQLLKEGKIKKPKALQEISEDEKPFSVPERWNLVRLGELFEIVYGKGLSTAELTVDGYDVFGANGVIGKYSIYLYEYEQLLVSCRGAYSGTPNISPPKCFVTSNSLVLENSWKYLSLKYFYYALTVGDKDHIVTGSAQPQVTTANLSPYVIAVPPLAEQHRIVAKVDELMALCDQLEQCSESQLAAHQTLVETLLATLTDCADADELAQNWARLSTHFDTLFTTEASIDALKQTILQLAVMGKLVPQDPSDEPASALLARIATEKAQLVKEKKIKKEKPLPAISEDEKPFELPQGWVFERIAVFGLVGTGATPSRSNPAYWEPAEINWVSSGETAELFVGKTKEQISKLAIKETNVSIYPVGTLIVAMYGQGKTRGQITELLEPAGTNQACAAIRLIDETKAHKDFVKLFFRKAYLELREHAAGGAQPNLNVGKIASTVIPLPPIDEQHRIVAKVDELMALCDQLKSRLQTSQQTQLALAESLVEGALA